MEGGCRLDEWVREVERNHREAPFAHLLPLAVEGIVISLNRARKFSRKKKLCNGAAKPKQSR